MKKTFIALFLAFICLQSANLSAQTFRMKDVPMNDAKKICYTGDIDVSGVTKDSLYHRAWASLKSMYKNFAGKVTKNDPVEGRIIMNGVMQSMTTDGSTGDAVPDARLKYILIIQVSDGKVNYNYSDFIVEQGKKRPLESYYYNEPEVKKSKQKQEDFFHSIDYQLKSDITTLTRKLTTN